MVGEDAFSPYEYGIYEMPKWRCPVCDDDVEASFYGIYTHLATHIAEVLKEKAE